MVKLEFQGVPHSRSVEQELRARIQRWMDTHHLKDARVKAEFFRSQFDPRVGCYLEVSQHGMNWRNFEYGKGLQHTLLFCLRGLAEISALERAALMERSA